MYLQASVGVSRSGFGFRSQAERTRDIAVLGNFVDDGSFAVEEFEALRDEVAEHPAADRVLEDVATGSQRSSSSLAAACPCAAARANHFKELTLQPMPSTPPPSKKVNPFALAAPPQVRISTSFQLAQGSRSAGGTGGSGYFFDGGDQPRSPCGFRYQPPEGSSSSSSSSSSPPPLASLPAPAPAPAPPPPPPPAPPPPLPLSVVGPCPSARRRALRGHRHRHRCAYRRSRRTARVVLPVGAAALGGDLEPSNGGGTVGFLAAVPPLRPAPPSVETPRSRSPSTLAAPVAPPVGGLDGEGEQRDGAVGVSRQRDPVLRNSRGLEAPRSRPAAPVRAGTRCGGRRVPRRSTSGRP